MKKTILIIVTALLITGCSVEFKTAFRKSFRAGNNHYYAPHIRGGYYSNGASSVYIPYSRNSVKWQYRSYRYNRPK